MDVVHNNIDQIGGVIDVKSVPGNGLSFTIKIPLTLAIVAALIVEAGGERFAIPQLAVVELVRARKGGEHRIERIGDTAVLRLREKLLPLARLTQLLGLPGPSETEAERGYIVVLEFGRQKFGLIVDNVFHTEEIVVKPMSSKLRDIAMFSGNTILGDGAVIMIVDPKGVVQTLGSSVDRQLAEEAALDAKAAPETAQTTSLLVFRAGSMQPKAVPLALITRLEEIDARTIELSNGRYMVQYRGQLMPLISVDEHARIKPEGAQPLLVFSDGNRAMALVVDEIIDIVDEHLDVQAASESSGVLGSAIVKGQATEFIDIGYILPLAFEDWFGGKNPAGARNAPRVLLVDDSAFFRDMLAPVLRAAGYGVTTATSAREALALIKDDGCFDALITAVEMAEMTGYELALALRADQSTAELPIIALSSVISADAIERGRAAGFHDYVAKFDRQGLIAALKEQAEIYEAA
jgi:two-component system chemotaxis sensor kinase CheA